MGDSEKTQLQSTITVSIPEPNVSASKIQNAFRNRLARIKLAEAKAGDVMTNINREREQKAYIQTAKENKSATKLQSAFRNRLARIKLAEAKAGDVLEQIGKERDQKATKLQSAFRNRLARINLAQAKAGDVMTQINREREQKAYNQKAKQNKSARKIQNMFKNKKIYNDAIARAVERD